MKKLLILLMSISFVVNAQNTTSCHHNLMPEVEETYFTKTELGVELVLAVAPVGKVAKAGDLLFDAAKTAMKMQKASKIKGAIAMIKLEGKSFKLVAGGKKFGMAHILEGHVKNFYSAIPKRDLFKFSDPGEIVNLLKTAAKSNPTVAYTKSGRKYFKVVIEGQEYQIWTKTLKNGDNVISTFFPANGKTMTKVMSN